MIASVWKCAWCIGTMLFEMSMELEWASEYTPQLYLSRLCTKRCACVKTMGNTIVINYVLYTLSFKIFVQIFPHPYFALKLLSVQWHCWFCFGTPQPKRTAQKLTCPALWHFCKFIQLSYCAAASLGIFGLLSNS